MTVTTLFIILLNGIPKNFINLQFTIMEIEVIAVKYNKIVSSSEENVINNFYKILLSDNHHLFCSKILRILIVQCKNFEG